MKDDYTLLIYDQSDEDSTREIYVSDKPIWRICTRSMGRGNEEHHLLIGTRNGGVIELEPTENGLYN